jgi:hypothetical protein
LKAGITQAGFKEIFHGLPAELRALKKAAHWRPVILQGQVFALPTNTCS